MMTPWLVCLVGMWWCVRQGLAVDCFTCSVDFRSEPYDPNNTCLFPPKDGRGRTSCNRESKYCQGIITRVNGVFVQIQRTCEAVCHEFCTEKGFGIETSECHYCCNDSHATNPASCGIQGYRSSGHRLQSPPLVVPLVIAAVMLLANGHYFDKPLRIKSLVVSTGMLVANGRYLTEPLLILLIVLCMYVTSNGHYLSFPPVIVSTGMLG